MNGYSGKAFQIIIVYVNDVAAGTKTDIVVAFFQNNATKNITRIPGVKKPVNSCMYWNADSKLPRRGWAQNTAIVNDINATFLPILISFLWEASVFVKLL